MKRTITRKEIFQHEIQTGATIEEIEIYTNCLQLVLIALTTRQYVSVNHQWIFSTEDVLSKEEQEELNNEISDLKRKIKLYKKKAAKF